MVSNLEEGVTEDDVKDLFSDVGPLKSSRIQYDESGASTGQAEVVYSSKAHAIEAIQRYNGVRQSTLSNFAFTLLLC